MWQILWPWLWLAAGSEARFRTGKASDSERLAELHRSGFAIGWSALEIERMLLDRDHACDVLVSPTLFGPIVTGFAISRIVLDEAELLSIAIDPELRGKGQAAPLLRRHLAHLARSGARALFLEVAEDNPPAIRLYEGLGFRPMGRRRGYYPATGGGTGRVDARTYRRDLDDFDPTPRAYA